MRTINKRYFGASQLSPQHPFPGIPSLQLFSQKPKPKCELTTLSNGIKVISQETYRTTSSLGLFINAGTQYETEATQGVSHLLEHMMFKSTSKRSHQRLIRDVELELGGSVSAISQREYFVLTCDLLGTKLPTGVSLLSEVLTESQFKQYEIDEQYEVIDYELNELFYKNPQQVFTELIYSSAYGEHSSLGRSIYTPKRNLNKFTTSDLVAFHSKLFLNPSNLVLSGAGVNHKQLVELAEKHLGHLKPSPVTSPPVSCYSGGEKRVVELDSQLTHLALTFSIENGWNNKDLLPYCVLHMLLGGGSSFSPGGPGKGMYSRLFTNVLNQNHFIESAVCFNSLHASNGLFGVYATCDSNHTKETITSITNELLSIKNLTQEEVTRAKNQLKSSIVMNLDSTQVLMEDLGRQLLVFNKRTDEEELSNKIDQVTAKDVERVAAELLKTKLTFTAFGDISKIPSYQQIAKSFQ